MPSHSLPLNACPRPMQAWPLSSKSIMNCAPDYNSGTIACVLCHVAIYSSLFSFLCSFMFPFFTYNVPMSPSLPRFGHPETTEY
ncbi:hypothetical protein BJX99DRAFT_221313 [Aspergillus californicus]